MTIPARLASRLIDGYQRHLSARKGWRCAHSVVHGGPGCSGAIREFVETRGVLRSARPSLLRFAACYQAAMLSKEMGVRGVCCCGPLPIPFRF